MTDRSRRRDAATRWIRGAVAVVYLALAVTNLLTLDGTARTVMTVLDTATAVLMALAAARPGLAAPGRSRGEWLAFVPVAVSVAQVAVTGRLHYSITLMLTLLAIGAAVTSRRVAAAAALLGCGGWIVTVATVERLHVPELGFYSLQMVFAAVLGAMLHEAIRRRQRQLKAVHEQVKAVAHRFEELFNASPAGVAIADGTGRVVAANPAFCELVGHADILGADVGPYLAGDGAGDGTREVTRPDGTVRWAYLTIGTSEVGGQPCTLVQLQDITDRYLAEEAVRDSDRLLAAVAAAARRIRTGEDARTTIIAALQDLAGADNVTLLEPPPAGAPRELVATVATLAEVLGTRVPLDSPSMIAHTYRSAEPVFIADADRDPRVSAALLRLVQSRSMLWQPVIAEGRVIAVLAVGWKRRVASIGDYRTRAVALLADETALALEHEKLLRRLEQMAFTDMLTALPNRRAWQETMDRVIARAGLDGEPLTVAIVDLDHFKRYNDTRGHAEGDELLRRAAAAFAAELRDDDVIARWGGEEFVVALPATGTSRAVGVLDRLRAATPDGQTCSIGVAVWNGSETAEQVLQRADEALYTAKNEGRNRIHLAPEVFATRIS